MDYGYSIINHNYSSSLQEESSKTFLNIRTSLFKKFPNLITIVQKIYSYLHSSKKLINKYSTSIILQKEKKEEKIKPTPQKCVFRLSRRISRRRSINRKRLLARHVGSVQRTGQRWNALYRDTGSTKHQKPRCDLSPSRWIRANVVEDRSS